LSIPRLTQEVFFCELFRKIRDDSCKSTTIVRNGTNRYGKAQDHCKDCGVYRVLKPKLTSSETEQQTVLRACLQRSSFRGVERIFDMARQTVAQWIKTHVETTARHQGEARACAIR